MSQEVGTDRAGFRIIALYVVVPGVILLGLLVFILVGGAGSTIKPTDDPKKAPENHLAPVRATLAKQNDLATCKTILPQLNAHMQQKGESSPAPMSAKEKETLRGEFELTADERKKLAKPQQEALRKELNDAIDEVSSPTFLPLDAHHLAACFLLRDAARSMELATPGGRGGKIEQTPLDRAELAFAWVMRQVRLHHPAASTPRDEWTGPVPPVFALRRGWGSALERALVFLALLEQFGLDDPASRLRGVLLYCPDAAGKKQLWACGVAAGDKPAALYLFDPRLGLPLPGANGKGIATLKAAREDPAVLSRLQVDKVHYDVKAAQAKAAEAFLVVSLSALAPRMTLLQDHLLRDRSWRDQALPAQVRVRLAENLPLEQKSLQLALKQSGSDQQISPWREGGLLLRRFLPKEEGGSDVARPFLLRRLKGIVADDDTSVVMMTRYNLYQLEVAPWEDFPKEFRRPGIFGPDSALGKPLRQAFGGPFLNPLQDPNSTRELILRGRETKAAPDLVREQSEWQQMRARLNPSVMEEGLRQWLDRAIRAYANLQRAKGTADEGTAKAQVAELWRWRPGDPIEVVLMGSAAEARAAEVTFQLGLCKHELAARLQARKELAARNGVSVPEDERKANEAWKDAEGYWKEYMETYPKRPGMAAAVRLRGEALANRNLTKEAIATWQDTSAAKTDLEKLANLWLAKQLGSPAKAE